MTDTGSTEIPLNSKSEWNCLCQSSFIMREKLSLAKFDEY